MSEYDSPWREALDLYFERFLAFFFPQAHAEIDWARGYEMLETELQQVIREAALGPHRADKLAKVWLHDGEESWILIHVEIQSQEEAAFPRRAGPADNNDHSRARRRSVGSRSPLQSKVRPT